MLPNRQRCVPRSMCPTAGPVRGRRRHRRVPDLRVRGVARGDRRAGGRALRGEHGVRAAAVRAVRRGRAHTRVQQDQVQDT